MPTRNLLIAAVVGLGVAIAGCGSSSAASTAHHRYCAGLVAQIQANPQSEAWYRARLASPGGFPPCIVERTDGTDGPGPGSGL